MTSRLLALASACAIGACSQPAPDPPRVETAEQWTASVVAEYGSIDGNEPAELFGGMVTALLLEEGRVLAVDHQSRELRWFSPGQPPRVGGGVGNGPGEFRAVGSAAVGPDRVIHLTGVSSISRFDESGNFLGRQELDFGALSSLLGAGSRG